MRGPWAWVVAAVAGVVLVVIVTAMIGNRDKSDETVPAGEWAQSVCGAIGVWRGELEAIVEDVRTPNANASGTEEPQSETPQGRTGFVRDGPRARHPGDRHARRGRRERGRPRHDAGRGGRGGRVRVGGRRERGARGRAGHARRGGRLARGLDRAATPRPPRAIGRVLTLGTEAVAEVARTDPALASALRDASTCQELQEETS